MKTSASIEGLGLTRQRAAVLRVVRESEEHLTANDVYANAKVLLPGISFATVYNSLRYLKDSGHIAEVQFGSGASRFDRMTSRHDHAICVKCGALADIEIKHSPKLVKRAVKASKFKFKSLEFTLKGICPDCEED